MDGTGGGPVEVVLGTEDEPADDMSVTLVAAAGFGFEQECTLTIAAGFVDAWGNPVAVALSAGSMPRTLTFTTAEQEPGKR